MYEDDEWLDEEESARMQQALAIERHLELALQMAQDAQRASQVDKPPARKRLKRELQAEALSRLEDAARTEADFQNVVAWWDKLDANRERRERYHEISRSGDDLPLDYGADDNGAIFPSRMNDVIERQLSRGDFIDAIFNCLYELHELVSAEHLSAILQRLSVAHKEILFFHVIWSMSTSQLAQRRGQTERNIRKVRATVFRRIHRKLLPVLEGRMENGAPMTAEERRFVADMKKAVLDGV